MAASMFLVSAGRHLGSQWHFWSMVQGMDTQYMGGFSNYPMAERDLSANACQWTCGVSRTWPRRHIKRGTPFGTRQIWNCPSWSTSSTKGGAIMFSSWPSWSFEVVSNQVFCGSCGYIPHVCWYGQRWTHRNAAQIPGFTKSLCICNYTLSGWNRPKSSSSKPCRDNSEGLSIEWAAAGNCTSYPARATQSTIYMVTEYVSWWQWYIHE